MSTELSSNSSFQFKTVGNILEFCDLSYQKRVEVLDCRISKNQLEGIKVATQLNYCQISHMTGFTVRSFHTKYGDELFSPAISDLILQIVSIYGLGYKVFSKPFVFNKWMYYGCPETEYEPPFLQCSTSIGRDQIKREILRINGISLEGVFEYLAEQPPIPTRSLK